MIDFQAPARRSAGVRDAVDEKLIALLREDARLTLTALAQRLFLSRTAVQARMARLERDKVILGYRAVIDDRRQQSDGALGAILSISFSQRPCTSVVKVFRDWPEITQYFSVTGGVDCYLVVEVGNARALADLVDRLSAVPGVASVQSAVVLKTDQP